MRAGKVQKKKKTLHDAMEEFLAYKKAQKIRERTIADYRRYLEDFIKVSSNSLDLDELKGNVLLYFASIPDTSPARFNHPYQYLHALFTWCVKQDYLVCNPFDKLDLKKKRDEGNVQPASIDEIKLFLKCLDQNNYCELRDFAIALVMLDTGIRTSEVLSLRNTDYNEEEQSILIRPEVSKTSKSRTVFLSQMSNAAIKKFLKSKMQEWEDWLFPTRDGLKYQSNSLGRNFRKYCERAGVQFTPYQIRHSFATLYLQNGGDLFTLQRMMGHSDLQMTRRYTEIDDRQVCKSHSAYSPVGLLQTTIRKKKTK